MSSELGIGPGQPPPELSSSEDVATMSLTVVTDAWQHNIFKKTLRVIAIVALPAVVAGGYYVYITRTLWFIPLILIAYSIVLLGAFAPRLAYTLRVWSFLGVLFALGISDVLTYGWGEDVRIFFLGATLFATIFLRRPHGLVALIVSCVLLTLFVIAVIAPLPIRWGIVIPANYYMASHTTASLLSGLLIFIVFAVALHTSFSYMFRRVLSALCRSDNLSVQLEQEQSALTERTKALQVANANLQRRALYLASSTRVTQALARIFELDALLEQAVNLISHTFDFYHTSIFLVDEASGRAVLQATSAAEGRRMLAQGETVLGSHDSLVGQVLVLNEPCSRCAYVESTPEQAAADKLQPAAEESDTVLESVDLSVTHAAAALIISEVALPLLVAERLIGVLHIKRVEMPPFDADDVAFDADDIRTLQGLAGLLAVAIDNARRLGDEAAVLEAASPLYRLAHRLATTRTERDIYATMLSALQEFSPTQAFIFRSRSALDEAAVPPRGGVASGPLYLVAEMRGAETASATKLNFHEQPVRAETIPYVGAIANFGRSFGSPVLVGDLADKLHPGVPYQVGDSDAEALFADMVATLPEVLGVYALALVPMHVEQQCLGILLVTYNIPHQFTPRQGQLYRVLADLAGSALARMRLVQQAQMRLERERWLREFGEQVLRIPDLESLVVESAQLLQQAVQAEGVAVSLIASTDDVAAASGGSVRSCHKC